MKKVLSFITACVMASSLSANASEVIWSPSVLSEGEVTAHVTEIENGDKVFAAAFKGDVMTAVGSAVAQDEGAVVKFNYKDGDYAKIFVWDRESLTPKELPTSRITPEGVTDDAIFSDNQQSNKASVAAGYKTFDAIDGDYEIKIDITVVKKGDNAILLGDSGNGTLSYGTSSAILLFNTDSFSVRSGNGEGGYEEDAVALTSASEGKTYGVTFRGNAASNRYIVIVNDGKNEYKSEIKHARKNCAKLDTIALISNGKNTVSSNGFYSNFSFYGKNLSVNTESVEIIDAYDGFSGLFYEISVDDKYIRGNNGKVTADYDSAKDDSAKFFVKDMGDGSYALVCKSSNNRMTFADNGENLKSTKYNPNDSSQHWMLEECDDDTYYIKHIETEEYVVKNGDGLILSNSEKSKFVFKSLKEESKLYTVSKTEAYRSLSARQKFMLESVYSSVAGDMFGRYGGYSEWTPKMRMDKMFDEILSGDLTLEEQTTKLNEFLNKTNGFIYSGQANYEAVSLTLPGTVGCYTEVGEGVEGTYDFWRGTQLNGVKYPVSIFDAEGNKEQSLTVYVHDDDVAKHNYDIFLQAIIQIPYEYRINLKNVKIRNDTANSFNGGGNDVYVRLNWKIDRGGMRSTLIHELGHVNDQSFGNWSSGSGWSYAIAQDMYTPSTYGGNNNAEDFAEFSRIYFQCYNIRDMQRGLKIIMPERYASFERMRNQRMNGWGLW